MTASFEQLNIHTALLRQLANQDIQQPTDIQRQSIPLIAEGKDVIAQSQTGTGKTLAYLLPLLQRINAEQKELQAVVVVPTRELGMQILREAELYGEVLGIQVLSLIGGAAVGRQIEKLRQHPHLVVGTPGRILELIKIRKLKMHKVQTIVVDEVDHVFELGGASEIEDIIKSAMRSRQLLFFSATVTEAIHKVALRWMQDPATVQIAASQRTAETLEHLSLMCEEREKVDTLRRLVRALNPASAIIFINETESVGEVVAKLQYVGLSVEALYADSGKQERATVLARFRDRKFQLLLATDVAARGLDIKGLTHVFNLDLPIDAEHYIHRAGRTGRMGQAGMVISIYTKREQFILNKFEKQIGIVFQAKSMYQGRLVNPGENHGTLNKRRLTDAPSVDKVRKSVEAKGPRTNGTPSPGSSQSAKRKGEVAGNEVRKPASTPKTEYKTKADRERDRKSKGAPRWLKEKAPKNQ